MKGRDYDIPLVILVQLFCGKFQCVDINGSKLNQLLLSILKFYVLIPQAITQIVLSNKR